MFAGINIIKKPIPKTPIRGIKPEKKKLSMLVYPKYSQGNPENKNSLSHSPSIHREGNKKIKSNELFFFISENKKNVEAKNNDKNIAKIKAINIDVISSAPP